MGFAFGAIIVIDIHKLPNTPLPDTAARLISQATPHASLPRRRNGTDTAQASCRYLSSAAGHGKPENICQIHGSSHESIQPDSRRKNRQLLADCNQIIVERVDALFKLLKNPTKN